MIDFAVRSSVPLSVLTLTLPGAAGRLAHEDRDLVLLHQMADAARQLLGHTARARDDGIRS
jgi:hypothetical protein